MARRGPGRPREVPDTRVVRVYADDAMLLEEVLAYMRERVWSAPEFAPLRGRLSLADALGQLRRDLLSLASDSDRADAPEAWLGRLYYDLHRKALCRAADAGLGHVPTFPPEEGTDDAT